MKKKRPFTLLEIMIVIFLIGLIGSIIGYNMKGSLEEGKAFKTRQGALKIQDILELELAKGFPSIEIEEHPEKALTNSGVVKNPGQLVRDGWGKKFEITVSDDNEVGVYSQKLEEYDRKHHIDSPPEDEN